MTAAAAGGRIAGRRAQAAAAIGRHIAATKALGDITERPAGSVAGAGDGHRAIAADAIAVAAFDAAASVDDRPAVAAATGDRADVMAARVDIGVRARIGPGAGVRIGVGVDVHIDVAAVVAAPAAGMTPAAAAAATTSASMTAAAIASAMTAASALAVFARQNRRGAQQQKGGQDRDDGFHETDSASVADLHTRLPQERFRMRPQRERSVQDVVKSRFFGVKPA